MDKIKGSISTWVKLVENHPEINLNQKFEAILNLFLVLNEKTVLKSIFFLELVRFLQAAKQLKEVMIQQVRDIATVSQNWYLTKDERIDLYVKSAQALETEQDTQGAFKVYFQAFKLIDSLGVKDKKALNMSAQNLVINALKSQEIINLEEVMILESVKDLKNTSKEVFSLAEFIISSDMAKVSKELDTYNKTIQSHQMTKELLLEKKRHI